MKKIVSFVLAITMVFGMISNPLSVQAAETDSYVADLLGYYKTYQESAATDIERVLSELKSVDEATGEAWENIMNYWSAVNTEGFANIDTVPEGLPEDNSMAVVILGLALNDDGTMKDELIGRLQAGLNVANEYENCYVVVTGGGTAANNKSGSSRCHGCSNRSRNRSRNRSTGINSGTNTGSDTNTGPGTNTESRANTGPRADTGSRADTRSRTDTNSRSGRRK